VEPPDPGYLAADKIGHGAEPAAPIHPRWRGSLAPGVMTSVRKRWSSVALQSFVNPV